MTPTISSRKFFSVSTTPPPAFERADHRKAWLLRVTVNCARTLAASLWRRRTIPLEDVYPYQDPAESAAGEALSQLDPKYRAVVHLRYYGGHTTDEIARLLNRRRGFPLSGSA